MSANARANVLAEHCRLFELAAPALFAWIHFRCARQRVSGLDPQDLMQEVWLRAFERFDSYDPGRSYRSWILGIAKKVVLQGLERSAGRSGGLSKAGFSSAGDIPASISSIGQRLSKQDALRRFMDHVATLDEEERALLTYCGIEQYTCAQAAERLGISDEAATKRWQKLRARLHAMPGMERLAQEILG